MSQRLPVPWVTRIHPAPPAGKPRRLQVNLNLSLRSITVCFDEPGISENVHHILLKFFVVLLISRILYLSQKNRSL